jgi:hypothetical protein
MCGIKTVQGQYNKFCETVALKDLPDEITLWGKALDRYESLKQKSPLLLPVNDEGDLAEFKPHELLSVYHSPTLQKYFHLHPELIHVCKNEEDGSKTEATVLCPECLGWYKDKKGLSPKTAKKQQEVPKCSLAAGLDFGLSS